MKPKLFRRKFIIYPQFQYAILAINIIVIFCTFLFIGIQLEKNFGYLYGLGNEVGLSADHVYFRFLDHHSHTLIKELTLAALISTIFSIFITVILSHKLAGPIIRLREHLKKYGSDKTYRPLSFRKGDFFSDLPEIVNKALSEHQESSKNREE